MSCSEASSQSSLYEFEESIEAASSGSIAPSFPSSSEMFHQEVEDDFQPLAEANQRSPSLVSVTDISSTNSEESVEPGEAPHNPIEICSSDSSEGNEDEVSSNDSEMGDIPMHPMEETGHDTWGLNDEERRASIRAWYALPGDASSQGNVLSSPEPEIVMSDSMVFDEMNPSGFGALCACEGMHHPDCIYSLGTVFGDFLPSDASGVEFSDIPALSPVSAVIVWFGDRCEVCQGPGHSAPWCPSLLPPQDRLFARTHTFPTSLFGPSTGMACPVCGAPRIS